MARAVVAAVLLALVAVLTPAPSGPEHVLLTAVPGNRAPTPNEALSEEEPNREHRKGPEPRTLSSAQRAGHQHRACPSLRPGAAACARVEPPEPVPLDPATDHLHTRLTPSTLQVFRN
ncbi:hypothetical protein [Saccharothrix australiensis]|uniref:Uncharacterized protein n=1 Tax=Saccharothrix australiensis TaxID=2072 RepID=A0A495VUZ9_9PSEU|nr:hypothetical protein [Saccharothrix australiensis]RKT53182.1 hypothetical protein C8E97_1737 [Saccharothrix australiensis]